MPPTRIYTRDNLTAAYHLRYAWTGWPTSGTQFPVRPDSSFFEPLDDAWHTDHLRRIATDWQRNKIQFTFSTIPTVSPAHFVARVKGRLQHALRLAGFRPNSAVKSLFVASETIIRLGQPAGEERVGVNYGHG